MKNRKSLGCRKDENGAAEERMCGELPGEIGSRNPEESR